MEARDHCQIDQVVEDPLAHLSHEEWVQTMFPDYAYEKGGDHHIRMWDWAWQVKLGQAPKPYIACWARKGGKSSSVEMMVAATILRGQRKYWLYVSETQDQADEHVQSIAHLFERPSVAHYYPHHGERSINKFGVRGDWRRNRMRTKGGGIVDALGLKTAKRGIKVHGLPPDGLALDDLDHLHDTAAATRKKSKTVKNDIMGMCVAATMVIVAQNKIVPNGIMARLLDGRADYLVNRIIDGPIPAIQGLKTKRIFDDDLGRNRDIIIGGIPTWQGQGIEDCQILIDRLGLSTFKQEQQHEVDEIEGALWTVDEINATRINVDALPHDELGAPAFKRVVVGNDPSGGGDDIGIIVGGLGYDNEVYIVDDRTQPGKLGPERWGYETVRAYEEHEADCIAAERNFGGDMVSSNIRVHSPNVPVKLVTASRGKAIRAEPVKSLWADGRVHLVGSFPELETEMTSWVPGTPGQSPNRLDAMVWVVTELLLGDTIFTGRVGTKRIR